MTRDTHEIHQSLLSGSSDSGQGFVSAKKHFKETFSYSHFHEFDLRLNVLNVISEFLHKRPEADRGPKLNL